jgi:hypothetical protein
MKNVFEAHPDIDTIYVVDGMPFLKKEEAESHERTTGQKMQVINKGDEDDELTPAGKAYFEAAAKIDSAKTSKAPKAPKAKATGEGTGKATNEQSRQILEAALAKAGAAGYVVAGEGTGEATGEGTGEATGEGTGEGE